MNYEVFWSVLAATFLAIVAAAAANRLWSAISCRIYAWRMTRPCSRCGHFVGRHCGLMYLGAPRSGDREPTDGECEDCVECRPEADRL